MTVKTKLLQILALSAIFLYSVEGRKRTVVLQGDVKTNRPIIGILAQDDSGFKKLIPNGDSYIASSYIKYVEAAGARVIPIRNNLTEAEIIKLFYKINGIMMPGGGVNSYHSKYANTAKVLFKLAKETNQMGDVFPIWATCLGFEMLHIMAAHENHDILTPCDAENLALPLDFKKDFMESRLLKKAPKDVLETLSTRNVTMHMHKNCITVETFKKEKALNTFFNVIATNKDRKNIKFISLVEGKKFPFYGSQFHPEKNQFEWTLQEDINHSFEAVKAVQYFANFFVNQARKSIHKFENPAEERKYLIFNYRPQNCFETKTHFDECYFF